MLHLQIPCGEVVEIEPDRDPELFWATAGGHRPHRHGDRRHVPVPTHRVQPTPASSTDRTEDLDGVLELMTEGDAATTAPSPGSTSWPGTSTGAIGAHAGASPLPTKPTAPITSRCSTTGRHPGAGAADGAQRAAGRRSRSRRSTSSRTEGPRSDAVTSSDRSRPSSTPSTVGVCNGLYGPRVSCNGSSWSPTVRGRTARSSRRSALRGPDVPRGPEAIRTSDPGATVVPHGRLDTRPRHPHGRR